MVLILNRISRNSRRVPNERVNTLRFKDESLER
jgi:hypothetical protein